MRTARAVEVVAESLREREDVLVDRMLSANAEAIGTDLDPDLEDAIAASARANLRAAVTALTGTQQPPESAPPGALDEARAAVRAHLELEALLRTYHIGLRVALDEALLLAAERVHPAEARVEALRVVTRYGFAHLDAVTASVTAEYRRVEALRAADRDERRLASVRAVLDGSAPEAAGLTLDLSEWHTAAVLSGREAARAAALLDGDGEAVITVAIEPKLIWVWRPTARREGSPDLVAQLRSAASLEVAVGIGTARQGVEGFRTSHREAVDALRLGRRLGARVTTFRQVALEAALASDRDAARAFIHGELGPLRRRADGDRLTITLAAYFAAQLNATAAAAALGISDRTVTNRLRTVEAALGESLAARRVELEVALRLERLVVDPAQGAPENRRL